MAIDFLYVHVYVVEENARIPTATTNELFADMNTQLLDLAVLGGRGRGDGLEG